MEQKRIISASILSADLSNLTSECQNVINDGADWIHLDIMDGQFVNNLTFGPPVVLKLRQNLPHAFLDAHLMTARPLRWMQDLVDHVDQITVHVESADSIKEILNFMEDSDVRMGLAVRPNTPIDTVYPYLSEIDYVLVMTVEPGFGGQAFKPQMLNKVAELKRKCLLMGCNVDIGVDGGVNTYNVRECYQAGANVIISGSGIFKFQDKAKIIQKLRNS